MAKSFRCNTYKRQGGGGPAEDTDGRCQWEEVRGSGSKWKETRALGTPSARRAYEAVGVSAGPMFVGWPLKTKELSDFGAESSEHLYSRAVPWRVSCREQRLNPTNIGPRGL
jgi:hypothetical protein